MKTFDETSSGQTLDHGSSHQRGGHRSRGGRRKPRPHKEPEEANLEAPTMENPIIPMNEPVAMSFEAKIGLALQGSNWQELQNNTTTLTVPSMDLDQESAESGMEPDVAGGDIDAPREMTAKQKKKNQRFEKAIAKDAGDVLEVIDVEDLAPVPQSVTWDEDPELLCSYNWQSSTDGTNTIFVPGEPAKWREPPLPHSLDPDSGFQYADYNYARRPQDPYSPMFSAMSVMNPDYQFNDVDVLADRNNLRVLLEFVQGKANGPFRLDLYTVFNTLIIVRKEARWWKLSDGVSFGCNFEKFFTQPAPGMEDATSHYRAIRYSMGPLNVVCRFEADAYDDGLVSDELSQSEANAVSGGLADRPSFNYRAPIRVLQKGHIVPTAQMVELKTQKYDPERFRPVACQDQLWFGRTSLLFTGPYEAKTGVVKRVKREIATERVKKWETNNQESLRKLVTLLDQLRAVLKRERRPNRAVVLVREDKAGPISIRSMEGMRHAVGREFFTKHWTPAYAQRGNQPGARGQRGGRGRGHANRAHGQVFGGQMHGSMSHGSPSFGGPVYANSSNENQAYTPRGQGFVGRSRGTGRGRGGFQ